MTIQEPETSKKEKDISATFHDGTSHYDATTESQTNVAIPVPIAIPIAATSRTVQVEELSELEKQKKKTNKTLKKLRKLSKQ